MASPLVAGTAALLRGPDLHLSPADDGSTTCKQSYIAPTGLVRDFGFSGSLGGWLHFLCLQRVGAEVAQRLWERALAEPSTTLTSHHAGEISLAQTLRPEMPARYGLRATGEMCLLNPNRV
jgi:hypothetical protein